MRADNFNRQLNTDLSGTGLIVSQFLIISVIEWIESDVASEANRRRI